MKSCKPLWREAHSESKVLKTGGLGALLEFEMSRKCTPLWHEPISKSKSVESVGMSTKCMLFLQEARLEVKMLKGPHVQSTFGRRFVWQG